MIRTQIFLLIFLCLWSVNLFGQSDTVFLVGQSRHYGDSVVLRWNATNAYSFADIYGNTIVVQRKNNTNEGFETLAKTKGTPSENWGITQNTKDNTLILAAASIYKLPALVNASGASVAEQLQNDETANFYWSNISLSADLRPAVANFCNLRFCDLQPLKNQESVYRIYVETNNKVSDTLYFILPGNTFQKETPAPIYAIEDEKSVELKWKADRKYSAYYVQKSKQKEIGFFNLNDHPIAVPANRENPVLYYKDSVVNYQPAYYRLLGVDMFGDASSFGEPLQAQGRDRTPPPMPIGLKVTENRDKSLTLHWQATGKAYGELGLAIGLKHHSEEEYKVLTNKLLPVSQTHYTFNVLPDQNDYYLLLQLFDTAGNGSKAEAFYQLVDSMPPAKPTGLKAIVDKQGVVKITWQLNTEKDLDGYLIYFANSAKAEKSGIVNRPLFDTIYHDTLSLKMLNKEVYYQIQAVDKRFNRSPLSELVKVMRPDTLKPTSPLIRSYMVTDSIIQLRWVPSSSVDVVKHELYRVQMSSGQIRKLTIEKDTLYTDREVQPGEKYSYYFTATDDSENTSLPSNTMQLQTYKNTFVNQTVKIKAEYIPKEKAVKLTWETEGKDIKKIVIYKGLQKEAVSVSPMAVKTNQKAIKDIKVKPNTTYYYAIKIYWTDGRQSALSEVVEVVIGEPN